MIGDMELQTEKALRRSRAEMYVASICGHEPHIRERLSANACLGEGEASVRNSHHNATNGKENACVCPPNQYQYNKWDATESAAFVDAVAEAPRGGNHDEDDHIRQVAHENAFLKEVVALLKERLLAAELKQLSLEPSISVLAYAEEVERLSAELAQCRAEMQRQAELLESYRRERDIHQRASLPPSALQNQVTDMQGELRELTATVRELSVRASQSRAASIVSRHDEESVSDMRQIIQQQQQTIHLLQQELRSRAYWPPQAAATASKETWEEAAADIRVTDLYAPRVTVTEAGQDGDEPEPHAPKEGSSPGPHDAAVGGGGDGVGGGAHVRWDEETLERIANQMTAALRHTEGDDILLDSGTLTPPPRRTVLLNSATFLTSPLVTSERVSGAAEPQ